METSAKGSRAWSEIALRAFALVALAVYLSSFLRVLWRIGDEGSIIYGAQRVTEGEVPYRDFFEVIGPGAFYWFALWFKALGTSWATSRLAILLTAVGSAAAIHYVARRYYRGPLTALPPFYYAILTVPLWPGANHHFDSNLWVLLAVAIFISRDPRTRPRAFLAGALAGIGSTFIPQKGVLVVLGLTLGSVLETFTNKRWRHLAGCLTALYLGLAVVGFATVLSFWQMGALADLVYACAIWPASQYHTVNSLPYAYGLREWFWAHWSDTFHSMTSRPLAWTVIAALMSPLVFIAALPFVFLVSALHRIVDLWRGRTPASAVPWVLWCAAVALSMAESHRPDIFHLINGSALLLVGVGLAFKEFGGSVSVATTRLLTACFVVLAAWLLLLSRTAGTSFETRRGTVLLREPDAALQFLQENTRPGEDVFVYPYYPMYYFLANVKNPTRYSILMYHMNTPGEFRAVIETLERRRVRFILWDTVVSGPGLTRFFPHYRHPEQQYQLLEQYLELNYREIGIKNNFRVLQAIH